MKTKAQSSYVSFYGRVIAHLASYNKWGAGTYNNKGSYAHIANLSGRKKEEVVKEIIESDCVPADLYHKPHRNAHHLNSSQVVCYEFFRPMMNVNAEITDCGRASSEMVNFVKSVVGVSISEDAYCMFEYEDEKTKDQFKSHTSNGRGERSQFDFFVKDGETEIYFEIKYTERTFGGWTPSDKTEDQVKNHCIYVKEGYKPLLEESPYFTMECKEAMRATDEKDFASSNFFFNKQYQLFRNALRAGSSKYSVFIYPEANPGPELEFNRFKTNLIDGQDHIIALKWENLTQYMSKEFINKYIKIFE